MRSRLCPLAVAVVVFTALAARAALAQPPGAQAGGGPLVLYSFEDSCEGWRGLDSAGEEGPSCAAARLGGVSCLEIRGELPGTVGAFVKPAFGKADWFAFTHLLVSVYVPQAAPPRVQAIVYVKDTDLCYYQHLRKNYLSPGAWTHLRLDLTGDSTMWEFRGHYKPWDGYCRQDVQEFGVKFIGGEPYEGPFYVGKLSLESGAAALAGQNAIYDLRASDTVVGQYEKFELSFNLARTYSNPFDPEVVDVRGCFRCPDGRVLVVPGFFYQGYLRRMERGAEVLAPMGRSQWKVRFAPLQTGTYRYYVEVRDGDPIRSGTGQFECVPSGRRGFVRISSRDPSCFEFDDGSFYYPIGHNIASVHDARAEALQVNIPASEGTYAYDRILKRMAEAGEDFGRIWMSPWSFGLEWTKAYDVHYRGLGRYNLLNAWRLDHVLRAAEDSGVRVLLLITSHGELGDYESDFWGQDPERMQGSPYWNRYGGPMDHPRELYTRKEALEIYKKKVRYIVARWGYSPAVMAWEILNEPDLASFYKNNETYEGVTYGELGAQFVKAVADHIRALDPAGHLLTSGCFRYQLSCAEPTLMLKEIDFNTGHVFDDNLEQKLLSDLRYMSRYQKIFLPTEAGLTPFAQDAESTALAMHRTLWGSFMTPGAGAAAPWWWVLVDRQDLYGYFRALSAFAQGEDRRGMRYEAVSGSVEDESGQRSLGVVGLTNAQKAFCWVYHPASFTSRATWETDPVAAATVTINDLEAGPRRVEVWDTYKGEVIERLDVESRAEEGASGQTRLTFKTPPFARDIACKVLPP